MYVSVKTVLADTTKPHTQLFYQPQPHHWLALINTAIIEQLNVINGRLSCLTWKLTTDLNRKLLWLEIQWCGSDLHWNDLLCRLLAAAPRFTQEALFSEREVTLNSTKVYGSQSLFLYHKRNWHSSRRCTQLKQYLPVMWPLYLGSATDSGVGQHMVEWKLSFL